MLACQRCKQTTNGPQAFLLTCRGCNKTWHHRCHMPPVEDGELMQRIRATNMGDTNSDLSSWACRRCKKGVSATPESQTPSHQDTGVRKSVNIVSATSPEDDFKMRVDVLLPTFSESTSRATSRISSQADNQAIRPKSVAEVPSHVHAASLANEREREVRPADGAAIQPRVNQDAEDDNDPEDLYGPPVERRIIRILPSLAEELREQRRRAAAEKGVQEKKRAPLAPDWIFARHVHDPLWKEIRPTVEGRKRRKPTARKLGDIGLNVNELVGYLTLQNSVREHKT